MMTRMNNSRWHYQHAIRSCCFYNVHVNDFNGVHAVLLPQLSNFLRRENYHKRRFRSFNTFPLLFCFFTDLRIIIFLDFLTVLAVNCQISYY